MTRPPDRPPGVAAGAAVAALLRGPARIGTVVGAFSSATVIGLDTPAGPRIVPLLVPGASATPHGVRMPGPLGDDRAGDRITLGEGRLVHRGRQSRIVRYWPTAVPPVHVSTAAARVLRDRLRDAPIGVPRPRVDHLASAMAIGDPSPAVRALLGAGAGLTPGGDDVLAGLLVGLRAVGRDAERTAVVAALGADLSDRTTALSADLLRLAADGHAMTPVLALLTALHGRSPDPNPAPAPDPDRITAADRIRAAADAVLAVGHTSGADLLTGLLLGLRPLPHRARTPARTPARPVRLPVPAGSRKDPS